ncbi:MAG: hypothetical protein JO208_14410 [Alphaproteobacteria bacterium]|nr:hypothetical protein [Alphaproteobacteria bacterium]
MPEAKSPDWRAQRARTCGIPAAGLAKSISRAPDGLGRITAASAIGAALDLLVDY